MSPTTGQATIDAIIRSALIHNYQTIKLKYAGGEPLLQFPLILDLHRYAQTQTKKYNLKLDGVILSNGTLLTNEIIKQMQTAHLRLMLSLDGIEAMHDCQRYYPDGHGSFKDVAKAIAKTIQEDLIPDISITVSGRNINGLPETVAWVLDHNLPFSLNFYRAHHTSDSQSNLHLDENCIIEGMLKAYKVIEHNLPDRCLLTSLVDRANLFLPHLQTCSACHNYLVFDTQGRVSKCQMDMAHPIANCYDTDPLGIIQQSKIGLQNLSVDKKTECHTCKWRYWCGGGCPRETFRTKGRYDAKSPNCNIYKALYPEVIRLESLRLSKYGKVQIAT